MNKRTITYTRHHSEKTRTESELRMAVEHHGDVVIASYSDDGSLTNRGKFSGWRKLLANLGGVDQVVMGCAGDIPGKTVNDLFKILDLFQDQGINLRLHREGTNTDDGAAAVLSLVAAYRRSKLSEAIKHGQAKALATGKRIGRPTVPPVIQNRIRAALTDGGGIRPTARRFKVSPAYVASVRRTMINIDMVAA